MSLIAAIHFRALALSHRQPLARHALFFWQAAGEMRLAVREGRRPHPWAVATLEALVRVELPPTAGVPIAQRAAELLVAFAAAPAAGPQPASAHEFGPGRGDAA